MNKEPAHADTRPAEGVGRPAAPAGFRPADFFDAAAFLFLVGAVAGWLWL